MQSSRIILVFIFIYYLIITCFRILLILFCIHFEGDNCLPTETQYSGNNDGMTTETEYSDSWLIGKTKLIHVLTRHSILE